MAECAVLTDALGARPRIWACAHLSLAIAWAPLSLGDEPTNGQPTKEEASQDAEASATAVLGPEAIEQANALRRDGDAEGAIALLRGYAPQNATMQAIKRMTLALGYAELKDWESALAQYSGVIEASRGLRPNMVAGAYLGAGQSCMELGRYEDAATHFEGWRRVAVEPQAGVHAQLSRAYKELGRYELAIENMEAGLQLAEEEVRTSDGDPRVVMYYRNQLADLRRLAAEQ